MAHNIDYSNGQYNFAHTGAKGWHKLGQQMQEGEDFDSWIRNAGFDYEVLQSSVLFADEQGNVMPYCDKAVLYRSDTGAPLAVMSDSYKVVQPKEVLYFFKDLVESHGMKLETAGVLRGGAVYWVMANTGDMFDIKGDFTKSRIMLSTACNGSLATQCTETSVRVVCDNTFQYSLADKSGKRVKVRHSSVFDEQRVKQDMGLISENHNASWNAFAEEMRMLAEIPVSDDTAKELFAELLDDKTKIEKTQAQNLQAQDFSALLGTSARIDNSPAIKVVDPSRSFNKLFETYKHGKGQDTVAARGTAFGLLQGVTRFVDHERRSHNQETRQESAWFGPGQKFKQSAVEMIREYAQATIAA